MNIDIDIKDTLIFIVSLPIFIMGLIAFAAVFVWFWIWDI